MAGLACGPRAAAHPPSRRRVDDRRPRMSGRVLAHRSRSDVVQCARGGLHDAESAQQIQSRLGES